MDLQKCLRQGMQLLLLYAIDLSEANHWEKKVLTVSHLHRVVPCADRFQEYRCGGDRAASQKCRMPGIFHEFARLAPARVQRHCAGPLVHSLDYHIRLVAERGPAQ